MAQTNADGGDQDPNLAPTAPLSEAKERLRLWLRLLKSTRRVEAQLRENLRLEFNSTLPRFDVMAALARYEDGLKMSALSGVLRVSNGNVTGIVDRLADEGLAERSPVPDDRRAMLVRLTRKGREAFAVQAEAHERWINELLGGFTPEQARFFTGQFDQINREDKEDGQ